MTILSKRLETIACGINKGETMADIGTDHGFLPIYLVEQGICEKTILADLSLGSLEKARLNVEEWQKRHGGRKESFFSLRSGDGIEILADGEADVVVIAGMGGILMSDILAKDLKKTNSMGRYILQPRNHAEKLRYWLLCHGYTIEREQLVREGKYICEIITAKLKEPETARQISPFDLTLWMPPRQFEDNGELALELAGNKVAIEKEILERLKLSKNPDRNKIMRSTERVSYLMGLIEKGRY